jgi:hypothetical protein
VTICVSHSASSAHLEQQTTIRLTHRGWQDSSDLPQLLVELISSLLILHYLLMTQSHIILCRYFHHQAPESTATWTSAKITTSSSKSFQWLPDGTPLYIEARIQVPVAMGTWPAFWMLPVPNALGGWCARYDTVEQ